jgi:hypothetical protein
MSITIFEVQYEYDNPNNFQSRLISVQDWDTYIKNIKNYKAHNSFDYTIPRTTKPQNMVVGDGRLEFDYIVPATGKLRHHMSWKVQIKH